jgi:hypothetical protein
LRSSNIVKLRGLTHLFEDMRRKVELASDSLRQDHHGVDVRAEFGTELSEGLQQHARSLDTR